MLSSQVSQLPTTSKLRFNSRQAWAIAVTVPAILAPLWLNAAGPGPLGTLSGLVLLLLLIVSTVTDCWQRKIYNWATYTAFGYAIAVNTVFPVRQTAIGSIGLSQSLMGAAVCFLLMLVAYTMARGGAGDVKLATAIGALCGVDDGLLVIAFTYIIAGVAILGWTIWTTGPLTLLAALLRRAMAVLFPNRVAVPTEQQALLLNKPIPLAGFFAAGTLCVVFNLPDVLRSL